MNGIAKNSPWVHVTFASPSAELRVLSAQRRVLVRIVSVVIQTLVKQDCVVKVCQESRTAYFLRTAKRREPLKVCAKRERNQPWQDLCNRSIMAGVIHSKKAEYICADQPATLTFRLQQGGGPYICSGAH
jgi:hypothetical protein